MLSNHQSNYFHKNLTPILWVEDQTPSFSTFFIEFLDESDNFEKVWKWCLPLPPFRKFQNNSKGD